MIGCNRRLTLIAPSGEQVFSAVYDPREELWQEVIERLGDPAAVDMVKRSYCIDGPRWSWDYERRGEVCEGYLALGTDAREPVGSPSKERNEIMAKKKTSEPPESTKPPKLPEMKVVSFTRDLKVPLTPPEVAERADRAARLLEDRDRAEAELKSYATTVKGRIATMEAEMRELSGEVRNKFTYREVECERRFVFTSGMVQEVRLDTEEVLAERAMTEKEKQRDLPFDRVAQAATVEPQDTAAE